METSSTLLLRVRNTGDTASWREFVAIYEPLIIAYARSQKLDELAAREVAQDVFVRLLKALPEFELDRARARFRTWLWQVTRGAIVDPIRRNGRRIEAEKQWNERRPSANEPEEWRAMIRQRVLQHALQKVEADVRPGHWDCFQRHLREGKPAAVVAAELGITTNAVFVNASRVLDKVRTACAEAMGGLTDDADDLPG
jgi:RNA polymerase sigma factor (sigma-70 family)